jgi:hypothetical protein
VPVRDFSTAERITVWTTVRLLFWPARQGNVISQRILDERNLIPAVARKVIETVLLAASVLILPLLAFLFFGVPLLWLLSPAILATTASLFSLRILRTSLLDYVGVTTLPDEEVITGLVGGVLTRLPAWHLGVTLLVPVVLLTFIASAALLVAVTGDLNEGAYALVALVSMLIGLVGANVLGTALGVMLALWQRDLVAIIVGAPTMVIFVAVGLAGLRFTFDSPLPGLIFALVYMVSPYLLATGVMKLSRRWIREIV